MFAILFSTHFAVRKKSRKTALSVKIRVAALLCSICGAYTRRGEEAGENKGGLSDMHSQIVPEKICFLFGVFVHVSLCNCVSVHRCMRVSRSVQRCNRGNHALHAFAVVRLAVHQRTPNQLLRILHKEEYIQC